MRISQNFRTPKIRFLLLPLSPANFFLTQNFRTPKISVFFRIFVISDSENFRTPKISESKILKCPKFGLFELCFRDRFEKMAFFGLYSRDIFTNFTKNFQFFVKNTLFQAKPKIAGRLFCYGAPPRGGV